MWGLRNAEKVLRPQSLFVLQFKLIIPKREKVQQLMKIFYCIFLTKMGRRERTQRIIKLLDIYYAITTAIECYCLL